MLRCLTVNACQRVVDLAAHSAQAAAAGYAALELLLDWPPPPWLLDPDDSLPPPARQPSPHAFPIAALTAPGCDLFSLAAPDGPTRRDALARLTELLRLARPAATTRLVIISPVAPRQNAAPCQSYESALQQLFYALRELADHAEDLATPLAIENPPARLLLSPLELRDLIDAVNSPCVGVCLNAAHARRLGDPADWLEILDRRVFALRLSPPAVAPAEQPWAALLQVWEQRGLAGPVIFTPP